MAYINLVLEPEAKLRWMGWEASLRIYRQWLRARTEREARDFVDANLELSAAPDALMYYPPVYYFHEALMVFAVVLVSVFAYLLGSIPVGYVPEHRRQLVSYPSGTFLSFCMIATVAPIFAAA